MSDSDSESTQQSLSDSASTSQTKSERALASVKNASANKANGATSKADTLPQTGEELQAELMAIGAGMFAMLALMGVMLKRKNDQNEI